MLFKIRSFSPLTPMARIARTKDGSLFCSNCSSTVDKDCKECPACEELLEGEFDAMVCSSCGGLISTDQDSCPICGENFKKKKPTSTTSTSPEAGDEFLSRLIEWGQGKKEEADTTEDIIEKEQAANILLKLQSTKTKEEKLSVEPLEVDERPMKERPRGVNEPLETAITTRKELVDQLINAQGVRRRRRCRCRQLRQRRAAQDCQQCCGDDRHPVERSAESGQ